MRPRLALCCYCLASRNLYQDAMNSDRNEDAAATSCEVNRAVAGRSSAPSSGVIED